MKEIENILGIQDRKNRGHGLQFKVKWARVKKAPSWESADLLIQEFPEQLAEYTFSLGLVKQKNLIKKYEKIEDLMASC